MTVTSTNVDCFVLNSLQLAVALSQATHPASLEPWWPCHSYCCQSSIL